MLKLEQVVSEAFLEKHGASLKFTMGRALANFTYFL